MKKINLLLCALTFLVFFSCSSDPEVVVINELFEYTTDSGESFSSDSIEMHYDSIQGATFVKYTDPSLKLRVNFKGNTEGVYDSLSGIFYKYSYNAMGQQNIELVCDTYTGIVVTVDKYGEIGESIEGSFKAENCDGTSDSKSIKGSFIVVRDE